MKRVIVHKVKRFPSWANANDGKTRAISDIKNREIWVKPNTSQASLYHERGHIVKHHSLGMNRLPSNYINDEVEATLYSYEKIGEPKHSLLRFKGWFNDLTNHYKLSPSRAILMIRNRLMKPDIPDTWKEDYKKLEREYRRVYR